MITKRTLYTGQAGTKKWQKKYGERLICVRYKYDIEHETKMITVELEEETQPWKRNTENIPKNKIVRIRVNYGEIEIGRKVRTFGGTWNSEAKLWELKYEAVQALDLTDRIVNST